MPAASTCPTRRVRRRRRTRQPPASATPLVAQEFPHRRHGRTGTATGLPAPAVSPTVLLPPLQGIGDGPPWVDVVGADRAGQGQDHFAAVGPELVVLYRVGSGFAGHRGRG